jgi:nucleoside-diphosphate-sugar epimerase
MNVERIQEQIVVDGGVRNCAITGTNGYLGSRLATAFKDSGWGAYRLSRQPADGDGFSVPFSLEKGVPVGFFKDARVSALVHCAYDFHSIKRADIYERNVEGSIRLLRTAKNEGVSRIVYISSMSAFVGCRSLYGKAKLAIEKEAFSLGASVVRPGLIYGDQPGGMVGALTKAVRASFIVPLAGNGRQVLYLTHEDDLVSLIKHLCESESIDNAGPLTAASEKGLSFRDILTSLAASQKRSVLFVPLPWRLFWAPLKALEVCGLKPGFRSDSVVSLVNQDPAPSFDLTRKTGIKFRGFLESVELC